ncbi:diguanylate cyclase [Massilia sp. PAMC28688]|uniref:GGDEF domain-containing protein n=1 Tax=Massilia sp. PAMC28688 TaxID=2861283 RepID=UPI001C635915|nr:diguanylate cyclase [Massilia sp. PAMC28688]QYF92051.1 diguanylate cyclase [Massilia sp. PAMC28688]
MTAKEFPDGDNGGHDWLKRLQGSALLRAVMRSAVLRNIALTVLWLGVWQLGLLVEYTEHASVWFPVAGLTFSVLLLDGLRSAPGLVAACVLITLWVGDHYQLPLSHAELVRAGLLWSVVHIGSYYAGARLLRTIAGRGSRELPMLVVSFLGIAALSSLLATVTGLWVLVATNMMPATDVAAAWLPYWIGDLAGVIVLAPFFAAALSTLNPQAAVRLGATFTLQNERPTPRFKYKLLLNLVLMFGSMWLAHVTRSPNSAFAIFFLVIPYMWIACTEPAFYNVLGVAVGSFVIALLVNVFGLKEFSMVYQFAINVIAANTLFGLALPTLIADNIKLRRVAEVDALTEAASRSSLERRARTDIARCRDAGEPLTLIVFDIDHFKQINDLYGHSMGDRALRQVSLLAQQCLRPADMLGRVGGDEFVALLPGITGEAALAIAERIRVHVHETELEGAPLMTASFGISQMHAGDSYGTIFERADRALYLAKQQGRNRAAVIAA